MTSQKGPEMPETPKKPKKTAKTVTLLDTTWQLLDTLREAENRTQSGQIEHMVLQSAASKK